MMDKNELQPCPFCGEPGEHWADEERGDEYYGCRNCQVYFWRIEDWNYRPLESALARCVQAESQRADAAQERAYRLEQAAAHNEQMAQAEKARRVEMEEQLKFHPRAAKLMRKRKRFVVVAVDEPYFVDVYRTIRANEQKAGRWTDDDERQYLNTVWG